MTPLPQATPEPSQLQTMPGAELQPVGEGIDGIRFAPFSPGATQVDLEPQPYTLGAGDSIQIDIFDVPEFSGANGRYTVLLDGSLNLPWVGKISVKNLTQEQAAAAIATEYSRFINDPLITVSLLAPRPLRIGVVGQVNRPGVYTVDANISGGAAQRYTVTQAMQAAGGITQMADIQSIEIRRATDSPQDEPLRVNLWSFLQTGELAQDVVLRDGDTLYVPEAIARTPLEASQLASTTFSPTSIRVNVVGEVVRPGIIEVPPNTPLNQAILAAGGFNNTRARRGEVELVRINPDGSISKRDIDIDFATGIDAAENPPLRSSDIVIVNRSTTARTSDFLNTLLTPINGAFAILRLFGFGR
ncbi:MAG: polysaccharide biosynthesis/export family protein [Kaiparowitsia implicata GSE-PSE-MK54-09C]|jgi:polysaccharide export outer membrane protein|nr:polysaccharide biosynthesis/export family protein [Kaiparowitsia implicata GSE-PSE-MK54-09C]